MRELAKKETSRVIRKYTYRLDDSVTAVRFNESLDITFGGVFYSVKADKI